MTKKRIFRLIIVICCLTICLFLEGWFTLSALADTMVLPNALQIIEIEAFAQNKAINRVRINDQCILIDDRAFYGCENLDMIVIPSSVQTIGSQVFTGCNKLLVLCYRNSQSHQYAIRNRINYWLYDGAVIQSAVQDGMGNIVLTCSNAGKNSLYEFTEYRPNGSIKVYPATSSNTIRISTFSDGNYRFTVKPICSRSGESINGLPSEEYTVSVRHLWTKSPMITSGLQISEGDVRLTWKGITPIDCYNVYEYTGGEYTLIGNAGDSNEYVIHGVSAGTHSYTVRGTYEETDGQIWITEYASPVSVKVKGRLVAPELIFGDGETPFSTTQASAPVIAMPEDVSIRWNAVKDAEGYMLTLDKAVSGDFENVLTIDGQTDTNYLLNENMFAELTEDTIYRLGLASNGPLGSEVGYSFFKIRPQDFTLKINNAASARWDHCKWQAGSRSFTVDSELSWTAESSASWITLQPAEDEGRLTATVSDMGQTGTRTGTVTVLNGKNTAILTVNQINISRLPVVSFQEEELSTDPNHPTEIPAGAFDVALDKKEAGFVRMLVSKKENNTFVDKYNVVTKNASYKYKYTSNGVTLSAGTELRIIASGHIASNMTDIAAYETTEDCLAQTYYVRMVAEGHQILFDGEENGVYSGRSLNYTGDVYSSNSWTATSDASWLKCSKKSGNRLRIYTSELNYTGADRTGHITLSNGSSSATFTYAQTDGMPRVISSSHTSALSQSENSPTTISTNYITLTVLGTGIKWEHKNGSSWVEDYTRTFSKFGEETFSFEDDWYFENGTTYRLTIEDSSNEKTSYYYIKRNRTGSKNILIDGERSQTKEISANSQSFTVSVTPSSSSDTWKAASDSSWLTVSPTSGSGNKTLTVTAAKNTTGQDRTGRISLSISNVVYADMEVIQEANHSLIVMYDNAKAAESTYFQHVSGQAKTETVMVYSGGNGFSISRSGNWITVDPSGEVDGDSQVGLSFAENTTGSRRSGSVTFTCGDYSETLSVTQEPRLAAAALTSHNISTDKNSPTFLQNDNADVLLKWSHVTGASRYKIKLVQCDNSDKEVFSRFMDADGIGVQSATIPSDVFDPEYMGTYRLRITALDVYGNAGSSNSYYFICISGDAVFLNKKASQSMTNVSDCGRDEIFRVVSSGSWTATSSVSWITVSALSGSSNTNLTITIARNTGSARSGKVTVKCGSATAVINVSQCAKLTEAPALKSPVLSTQMISPTSYARANSMTVQWTVEPQASSYRVALYRIVSASVAEVVQNSRELYMETYAAQWNGTGSYTFDTSGFEEGQIYKIILLRTAEYETGRYSTVGTVYYLCVTPQTSYLTLKGGNRKDSNDFYAAGDDDYQYYTVTSSGTWTTQISDNSWIMVSKYAVDSDYLTEHGRTTADYDFVSGNSGDTFCISVLANDTGHTRTGTVQVSTAGEARKTITVTQAQAYSKPEITMPVLGTVSYEPVSIPMNDIRLSWTSGEGCNGKYRLTLNEKDADTGSLTSVWMSGQITLQSATIPASALKQNTHYELKLESWLSGDETTVKRCYYFTTGSLNELQLSVSIDWSEAAYGGYIDITASTAGGAGGYMYAYELRCNGTIETQTAWTSTNRYQFLPKSSGTYNVTVYARDSANAQKTYEETWEKTDGNIISIAAGNQYTVTVDAARQILKYTVISTGDWTAVDRPEWVDLSQANGGNGEEISFNIHMNDGETREATIQFTSSNGIASTLTIKQSPNLNPDTSAMILPGEKAITGYFVEDSITLPIGSTDIISPGTVTSVGDDIYRITLTINDWNQDGTNNNRYATKVFANQHLKEVNLADWGVFRLDTTKPPFNVPGQYTLNLWASTREGNGVKLDSMMVNVGWIGHIQAESIPTYTTSSTTEPNGSVDNTKPVLVLRKENNRYYVRIELSGETASMRWVDKDFIALSEQTIPEGSFCIRHAGNILLDSIDGLSSFDILFGAAAGAGDIYTLTVETDQAWSALSLCDWVTIDPEQQNGYGNGTIVLQVNNQATYEALEGSISITIGSETLIGHITKPVWMEGIKATISGQVFELQEESIPESLETQIVRVPLENVSVSIYGQNDVGRYCIKICTVVTDEDGNWSVSQLTPDRPYCINAEKEDYVFEDDGLYEIYAVTGENILSNIYGANANTISGGSDCFYVDDEGVMHCDFNYMGGQIVTDYGDFTIAQNSDGTYKTLKYNGNDTNITIPAIVSIIGERTFYGCDNIKSITIPEGIVRIEKEAFTKCESLGSVIIPESVSYIGEEAFSMCYSLNTVEISGIPVLAARAFANCMNLTKITVKQYLPLIGDEAFSWCDNLTVAPISSGTTSIGAEAFEYCDRITEIIIPDSVTSIGSHAFMSCHALQIVSIPASVAGFGSNVFEFDNNIREIHVVLNSIAYDRLTEEGWADKLVVSNDPIVKPDLAHGLFAEFFIYDQWFSGRPDTFMTAENKRFERVEPAVDFSWKSVENSYTSSTVHIGGSVTVKHRELEVYSFSSKGQGEKTRSNVLYVPGKFGVRLNGYLQADIEGLKGRTISLRLRGDNGIMMELAKERELPVLASDWDWDSDNVAVFPDGITVGDLYQIEVNHYSNGGDANLILEYNSLGLDDPEYDQGWTTVPSDWLYRGERTVYISGRSSIQTLYALRMDTVSDTINNYAHETWKELLSEMVSTTIGDPISSAIGSRLNIGNDYLTGSAETVKKIRQRIISKSAEKVKDTLVDSLCSAATDVLAKDIEKNEFFSTMWNYIAEDVGTTVESIIPNNFNTLKSDLEKYLVMRAFAERQAEILPATNHINEICKLLSFSDYDHRHAGYKMNPDAAAETLLFIDGDTHDNIDEMKGILSGSKDAENLCSYANQAFNLLKDLEKDNDRAAATIGLLYAENGIGWFSGLIDNIAHYASGDLSSFEILLDIYIRAENAGNKLTPEEQLPILLGGRLPYLTGQQCAQILAADQNVSLEKMLYKELLVMTMDAAKGVYKGLIE